MRGDETESRRSPHGQARDDLPGVRELHVPGLQAERDALQQRVWPRLRELCRKHGARFQAIDLRWGVSEEAGRDQRAMQICLEEIRRCQQVTPRPNFVVLTGDRYGWRPLPPTIPQDEFDAILKHATDPELLKQWYALDENAVPPEYCLRGRGELSYEEWQVTEGRLHRVLLEGARAAGLSEEAMVKFERSATEQEIIEGALEAGQDHAFSYVRTIEGLPEDERAKDFIDLDEGARSRVSVKELPKEERRRSDLPRPPRAGPDAVTRNRHRVDRP